MTKNIRTAKTMLICRPCAEKMKDTMNLKQTTFASRKETCCGCGRRRFCLTWEVGKADD